MKKIVTATGNDNLSLELKKINNIKIFLNDILYKEGIIEILEEYPEIDYLILDEKLDGEISLKELIEKIKKINNEIIIILITYEKNIKKEDSPYNKINYIFYKNIEINNLLKIIYGEDKKEIDKKSNIKEENISCSKTENKNIFNDNLKYNREKNNNYSKINVKKNNNKLKIKINSYKNKIKNKNKIEKIIKNKVSKNNLDNNIIKTKIICIVGNNGVGKSIISVNLSKINSLKNKKVLLIDYDIKNNSIKTIFGIKTELINKNQLIKINKNIDLLTINYNNEFNENEKNKKINYLENIFNKIKNNYEYIFIDTNSNVITKTLINILKNSDLNIFISDTNLLEINKSIKLLDKFILKNNINKNKFYVLFNKYNKDSIKINLLKNIFSEFNVLGYLEYRTIYNSLINKNNKYGLLNKKLKKEYLDINNKITKYLYCLN